MAYRKADGTIDPGGFDPGLEHRVKRLEDGWHPTAFKAEYPPKVDWVSLEDFMHLKKLFDKQAKLEADCKHYAEDCNTALNEVAELKAENKELVKLLDNHLGTPCEQVRHAQKVEKLKAEKKQLRDAVFYGNHAIAELEAELAKVNDENTHLRDERNEWCRRYKKYEAKNEWLRNAILSYGNRMLDVGWESDDECIDWFVRRYVGD